MWKLGNVLFVFFALKILLLSSSLKKLHDRLFRGSGWLVVFEEGGGGCTTTAQSTETFIYIFCILSIFVFIQNLFTFKTFIHLLVFLEKCSSQTLAHTSEALTRSIAAAVYINTNKEQPKRRSIAWLEIKFATEKRSSLLSKVVNALTLAYLKY